MTNQGKKTYTINPGGSQTIPAGYHNGSGKVTANANQNSGTYTFASGNGATVDMGVNNTYRYVNASNVYNKGKIDGFVNGGDGVPTMTSNTNPSGQVFSSGDYSGQPAWQAFDKNDATTWSSSSFTFPVYIGYKFSSAKTCYYAKFTKRSDAKFSTITAKYQASNNNSTWVDLTDTLSFNNTITGSSEYTLQHNFTKNTGSYLYYRLYITNASDPSLHPTMAGLDFCYFG